MAKRKSRPTRQVKHKRARASAPRRRARPAEPAPAGPESDPIAYSNMSLHDLFQQQAMQLLDRTDLDEEQKQSFLVAMSCPCCGAGAMSFTAKIRRRS
jgi:hypothetical protein